MYRARETRTGRIVHASDALAYGAYQCPVCMAAVSVRQGSWRAAHFAHRSGLGTAACENYFPSVNSYHIAPHASNLGHLSAGSKDKIAPLLLSIVVELENDSRAVFQGRWGLNLTVPKSPDVHGKIVVDCGINFSPTISLLKLSQGAQTYTADPNSLYFRASWVSHEVSAEYRAVVIEPVTGLNPKGITAFAVVSQKQKPRVASLSWATEYYFVWHESLALDAPKTVAVQTLSNNGNWRCALVSLPDEEDEDAAAWLRAMSDLVIVKQKRRWGILYPTAHQMDIFGRSHYPVTTSFFVGRSESVDSLGTCSVFSCTQDGVTTSMEFDDNHSQFLEVKTKKISNTSMLRFEWDDYHPFTVGISPVPVDAGGHEVVISFVERPGGLTKRVSMHLAACKAALLDTRRKKFEIAKIQVPSAFSWQFRWKSAEDIHWQIKRFAASTHATSRNITLSTEDVLEIGAALSNSNLDVHLDFGAFGSFRADACRSAAEPVISQTVITRQTRAAILWYCSAVSAYTTSSRQVVSNAGDDELVTHFKALAAPPYLVAHKRSIERQLVRVVR